MTKAAAAGISLEAMRYLALVLALLAFACSSASPSAPAATDAEMNAIDAGVPDAGAPAGDAAHEDAAEDASENAKSEDAETAPDASPIDAGPIDAGTSEPQDAGVADTYGPYGADGNETFTTFSLDLMNGGRTFTEHFYLPDSAGPHPVVLFAPGTQQPASSYEMFFRRLASWGMIVIARNDPGPFTRTQVLVEDLVYLAAAWLPAQNADANSALFGRVDLSRIGVAGHSRGGKATLLAAEGGLKGRVLAYFGVDMIDVTFIDDGVYAQTEVAGVGIPTLFLVASVPGGCSPAHSNGEVLYNLASSPSVLLTAVGADHTDFATPCVGCTLACGAHAGTADPAVVRDYTARYLTAFFARELLGDAAVGAALEGAGASLDETAGLIEVSAK